MKLTILNKAKQMLELSSSGSLTQGFINNFQNSFKNSEHLEKIELFNSTEFCDLLIIINNIDISTFNYLKESYDKFLKSDNNYQLNFSESKDYSLNDIIKNLKDKIKNDQILALLSYISILCKPENERQIVENCNNIYQICNEKKWDQKFQNSLIDELVTFEQDTFKYITIFIQEISNIKSNDIFFLIGRVLFFDYIQKYTIIANTNEALNNTIIDGVIIFNQQHYLSNNITDYTNSRYIKKKINPNIKPKEIDLFLDISKLLNNFKEKLNQSSTTDLEKNFIVKLILNKTRYLKSNEKISLMQKPEIKKLILEIDELTFDKYRLLETINQNDLKDSEIDDLKKPDKLDFVISRCADFIQYNNDSLLMFNYIETLHNQPISSSYKNYVELLHDHVNFNLESKIFNFIFSNDPDNLIGQKIYNIESNIKKLLYFASNNYKVNLCKLKLAKAIKPYLLSKYNVYKNKNDNLNDFFKTTFNQDIIRKTISILGLKLDLTEYNEEDSILSRKRPTLEKIKDNEEEIKSNEKELVFLGKRDDLEETCDIDDMGHEIDNPVNKKMKIQETLGGFSFQDSNMQDDNNNELN